MAKYIIDSDISAIEKEVIELEHREHINVAMRIDETLAILKTKVLAKLNNLDAKFSLSLTSDEHCTLKAYKGETEVIAGGDVLNYLDSIKIVCTPSEGYQIKTLKLNGEDVLNESTHIVTSNFLFTATSELIPEPSEE